jgi:collagenase-like PrtC family protease
MKFAVGYQLREIHEEPFVNIIERYKAHISEVYFSWLDIPSGRPAVNDISGYVHWQAQSALISDLKKIKASAVKLDLLFNGNCYGGDAISRNLCSKIYSILDYLNDEGCAADIVTTASPAIAYMVKQNYPGVEIRASVNMRIDSVKGMGYVEKLFDSFYIRRDFNRDLNRIKELKKWADANGKGLHILVNSGCMRDCSCQTFHDNAVSHNNEISKTVNIPDFSPAFCWDYLKEKEHWVSLLQNTWIRPEDLNNYEPYFSTVKLATRTHLLPAMVIDAYSRRRYYGNLLDLFEPGYGPALAPYIIDNSKFPDDWFEKTSGCNKSCHNCSYCESVLKRVLIDGGNM